ncbi:hypothetical protein HN51_065558 [Arachis hypogaea]
MESGTRTHDALMLPRNPREFGSVGDDFGEEGMCIGCCRLVNSDGDESRHQLGSVVGTGLTEVDRDSRAREGRLENRGEANSQRTLVQGEVPRCFIEARGKDVTDGVREVGRGSYIVLEGDCRSGKQNKWVDGAKMLVVGLQVEDNANVGANDEYDDGANSETNGGANEELDNIGLETSLFDDKSLIVQNDGEGYGDREKHLQEEGYANDDDICDKLTLSLRGVKGTNQAGESPKEKYK